MKCRPAAPDGLGRFAALRDRTTVCAREQHLACGVSDLALNAIRQRTVQTQADSVGLAVFPRAFVPPFNAPQPVDALREPHAVAHFAQLESVAFRASLGRRTHERDMPEVPVVIVDRHAKSGPSVRTRALGAHVCRDDDFPRARHIRKGERRRSVGPERPRILVIRPRDRVHHPSRRSRQGGKHHENC